MVRKIVFILSILFILFSCLFSEEEQKYRFNYKITGEIEGRFLLFVNYKQFYEIGGSALFLKYPVSEHEEEFRFTRVDKPAYLLRSHGFSEKSLSVLTAFSDTDEAVRVRDKKLDYLRIHYPHVWKRCRNKLNIRFPFKIIDNKKNNIIFIRGTEGVVNKSSADISLFQENYQKTFFTYFNAFKIMALMLKSYNHNFFPVKLTEDNLEQYRVKVWKSKPLVFDEIFMGVMKLSSDKMHKYVSFRQRKPLRFFYRINSWTDEEIQIRGDFRLRIKVWKKLYLTSATRVVRIDPRTLSLIEDSMSILLKDKKGRSSWLYTASLNLM